MPEQLQSPLVRNPDDESSHEKTYLRQICRAWEPTSIHEALMVAEECYSRAGALVSILAKYTFQNNNISSSDITSALETVDDLLYVAYGLHMDYWRDEEDLMKKGWQPPKGKEVQP